MLKAFGTDSYRERRLPDGRVEWKVSVKLRDEDGRPTKQGLLYDDMMRPLMRSETERANRAATRRKTVTMRDPWGQVRQVNVKNVEKFTQQGFGHYWRPSGCRVVRGPDGMLWKWAAGWQATGVKCLGTPLDGSDATIHDGLQRDPDGCLWRGMDGEWVRLEGEA